MGRHQPPRYVGGRRRGRSAHRHRYRSAHARCHCLRRHPRYRQRLKQKLSTTWVITSCAICQSTLNRLLWTHISSESPLGIKPLLARGHAQYPTSAQTASAWATRSRSFASQTRRHGPLISFWLYVGRPVLILAQVGEFLIHPKSSTVLVP